MPLLIHGEVTDADVDIFDREAVFIDRTLAPLVTRFPALRIVFEHITTAEAAQFVADAPATVAATITPQHLHISRNAMLVGGIRPHAYCLPVAKREHHRLAVRAAAASGSPKFFLGTDSAPHAVHTKEAVAFVEAAAPNVAATITPQHLHINRNAMLVGGIRPHAYCLPVAKREKHRLALRRAATSGNPKFFLGTDSAPHARHAKESACGCAGIFNAPFALESYLTVFDEEGALDEFEGFASEHGPRFYGLPLNEGTVTLERTEVQVPETIDAAGTPVVPFHAGETLGWRLRV